MFFDARSARVWIWSRPIDFRIGMNGLSALVSAALGENPYCGDVFVFRSKRRDRLKLRWPPDFGQGDKLVSI